MHDHDHEHLHDHTNAHAHDHTQSDGHTHEHTHTHEHMHQNGETHDHEHGHTHAHTHEHAHDGQNDHHSHDSLLGSKAEAAAFLSYTLSHNAHHDEELFGLVHSLQHLNLAREAAEVEGCIAELEKVNARLEAVLAALK